MLSLQGGYEVSRGDIAGEATERAPTRGAPTGYGEKAGSGSRGAYEGTHKGRPYRGDARLEEMIRKPNLLVVQE